MSAQQVPSASQEQPVEVSVADAALRSRVQDLLHLLSFATIETPTPEDKPEAEKAMADIRHMIRQPAPATHAVPMTEAWFDSAMRLADAYADACFGQALNQRTEDPNPEAKREKLVEHLRHHGITAQAKDGGA